MKKNIIGGLIGLALLLPGVASATVNELEELRARINSLLAIVAQLQSQLASQTGASEGAFCFTFNTDLKIGDRGSGTGYLHKALEREGFSIPDSEKPQKDGETINDSFFGEATASRVSAFQEKYRSEILTPAGLSNGTGYLGARTRAKLNQLYGCNQTPCTDVTGSRCAYIENPNWYPKPIAMCDYPAPPENCKYVDGPNFNPTTQCGKILSCSTTINPIACTLEAKLCSDGKTYVGRTGPKCEFAACPGSTNPEQPVEKPDLIVGAVACEPLNLVVNQNNIFCQVTVWNNSSVDVTKSFDVNVQGSAITINGLKAQERKTVRNPSGFGFSIAGTHTINFPIDIWNSVEESNENNNSHSITLNVASPTIAMCDYPAPPENCKYVDGPNFNPTTQCGKTMMCYSDMEVFLTR